MGWRFRPQIATGAGAGILRIMASRKTMNISLPPAMKTWLDQQVKELGFGTSSEFVRHVIREAWENATASDFEKFVLEGLEGDSTPLTEKDWDDMKRAVRRVASNRSKRRKSA